LGNPDRTLFVVTPSHDLIALSYASSLMHLLAHECKLREEAEAKKGETKGALKPVERSVGGTPTATVRCHERSLILFLLRKPLLRSRQQRRQ
jgi:hypothetical protein